MDPCIKQAPVLSKQVWIIPWPLAYNRLELDCIRKIINFWYTFGWKWRVFVTIWDCRTHVCMTSSVEWTDLDSKISVALLSILSKIIERHVSKHLKLYLNRHQLLYECQSGCRTNHSCETALTAIVDGWITAIDNNEMVGTVFLDLSKAFDLVDHEILLDKLTCYQFNAVSLKWFSSYLHNRCQQVSISGKLSSTKHIKSGVAQVSVLGQLLFMIYLNDLALETNKSLLDFFADALTMTVTGTSVEGVSEDLSIDAPLVGAVEMEWWYTKARPKPWLFQQFRGSQL